METEFSNILLLCKNLIAAEEHKEATRNKNIMTLSETLDKIGADILYHLSQAKEPLTQWELYERSDLGVMKKGVGLSEFGWSFALEKLEKKHEIEFVSPKNWKLKDPERKQYLKNCEEITRKQISSD